MISRHTIASIALALLGGAGASAAVATPAASPPPAIQAFAAWAVSHHPEQAGRPWAVLDKQRARLYLFDQSGTLTATTVVLLGSAVGDDSVPGIGDRKISEILPFEKTTPAGRFDTEPGTNLQGEDIVWVDYDAAISMHRVRPLKGERRLQRLASRTARDNRISYGCINVPAAFYDQWLKPSFGRAAGVLYVLPETRSAAAQFGAALPATATAPAMSTVPPLAHATR